MVKAKEQTTVVVGMSGGVDSSVAACLLKEQGYRVVGLFMKNWDEKDENGVCTAEKDYADVVSVCERLGIAYYSVDFIKEYWDSVFKDFLAQYKAGLTPNPDVLCNREIKFNVFFKEAMSLGADFLATGHYAQTDSQGHLIKGVDAGKDQSYFLHAINHEVLKKVLFPVGALQKSEVREVARKHGLSTHAKKDSTGICFIGERDFTKFLSQYLAIQPGDFQLLDGTKVGRHSGVAYYTLGQRKGLGLGGQGEPWFVVAKDIEKNIVFVERGEKHPALYADFLIAKDSTWISGLPPVFDGEKKYTAKIRYRQTDQACRVTLFADAERIDRMRVDFDQPQRAITPGQSVVIYDGDLCLGGAVIERAGPSYFERGLKLS